MATPTSENSSTNGAAYRAQQRYSNDCLTQIGKSIVKKKLKATEMTVNGSMIDARTYTDVQSNGLAGRIVKYQENDARLRRSQTTGSLYKRPGHFPLVNLKKTQIPCTVKKKNLSMTRISPPEKSLFYGNTLSSLLRSNSIVCLQKSDEELSCENRPIMHPPPTNETVPTRSVLDVLKEISRKRINSGEEEDATDFNVKKYCNRDAKEVETAKTTNMQPSYRSPVYTSAYMPIKTPTSSLASPKRNVRNFNNDISSSLSSSLIYTNKRKMYDTPSKQTSPLAEDSMQRLQLQEGKRIKYDTIKQQQQSQPQQQQQPKVEQQINSPSVSATKSINVGKQRLTLFNKSTEENTTCTASNEEIANDLHIEADTCAGVQFIKPKKGNLLSGTKHPLIQRTIKSKLALMLSGLKGELYQGSDEDETDARKATEVPATATKQADEIANMKPTVVTSNVPILPTVTTSNDVLTKNTLTDNKPNFAFMAPSIKTAATESNLSTGSTAVQQNTAILGIGKSTLELKAADTAVTSASSLATATTTAESNRTAVTTTQSLAGIATSTTASNASSPATTKPIITNSFDFGLSKGNETAKPAFSFGNNVTNNISAPKADAVTPKFAIGVDQVNNAKSDAVKPNFTFGDNTATNNTAPKVDAVKPNFSFGTTNNNSATNVEPVKPNFSFGATNNNNAINVEPVKPNLSFGVTNNNSATNVEPVKPNFSFGATNNNNTANVEPVKPNFSFGATNNNNNNTANVEPVKPNFSFGATNNNNAANVEPAKPNFSFGATNNNNAANVEPAKPNFSFGATNNNNAANVEPAKPNFSFGATNNNNAANVEPAKPNFSFGATNNNNAANVEPVKPNFSFGATNNNNTTNVEPVKPNFSFGATNNSNATNVEPAKPNFSFGATNNSNATNVEPAKSNFSFGANSFNNNDTNKGAATNDAVKTTFTFGDSKFNTNNNSAAKVEAVKPTFSFGDNKFNNTATNNNNTAKVESVKPTFSFGENKNNTAPSFTFDGVSSTPANNNPAFGFGSAATPKTFEFNSPVSAVKPMTNDANSTTTNNIFGSAIKPFQSDTGSSGAGTNNLFGVAVKPFTSDASTTSNPFGTSVKPANTSNNLFGSAVAKSTAPTFNFTASNGTNSNSATFTPINNNIFAPNTATNNEPINNLFAPPKSTGPSDRPIRRATRRLNNKQ